MIEHNFNSYKREKILKVMKKMVLKESLNIYHTWMTCI